MTAQRGTYQRRMLEKRSRFVVELTDAEHFALDGVRATLGLRSKADVIRHWIKLAKSPETLGHHGPKARDK